MRGGRSCDARMGAAEGRGCGWPGGRRRAERRGRGPVPCHARGESADRPMPPRLGPSDRTWLSSGLRFRFAGGSVESHTAVPWPTRGAAGTARPSHGSAGMALQATEASDARTCAFIRSMHVTGICPARFARAIKQQATDDHPALECRPGDRYYAAHLDLQWRS